MSVHAPTVLIITGLMAAGKSTVGQAVAERLSRSVHLRGDVFRKMIVAGRVEMTPEPNQEALNQLSLRYELACNACVAYAKAGFSVIYQDVILGRQLAEITMHLTSYAPGVVVLNPSSEVVAIREAQRPKSAYSDSWTPEKLGALLDETPAIGLWLDTSQMSVAHTADYILNNLELTRRGIATRQPTEFI